VRRFDALTLSLAELALNLLFAVLFLMGAQAVVSGESTADAAAPPEAVSQELEGVASERDALAARLEEALAAETRLEREIDDVYERMARHGLSDLRPSCPGDLFEGAVLSATTIRIDGEVWPIDELERRFPGTDRRSRPGCVHPVRVRFESMDGRSYERALRALEDRYRVYREDS